MPRQSPYTIRLSSADREGLEKMVRKYTSPYCDVVRAKIALYAAEGLRNDEIPSDWTFLGRSSASGANDSSWKDLPAWRSGLVAGAQPAFPPGVVGRH